MDIAINPTNVCTSSSVLNQSLPQVVVAEGTQNVAPRGQDVSLAVRRNGEKSTAARLLKRFQTGGVEKFKWQPDQQFLICGNAFDKGIAAGIKVHRNEKHIPRENSFSMAELQLRKALEKLDINSRLTVHGHANDEAFGYRDKSGISRSASPQHLARFFCDAGLTQVGVLKFKACSIGKGTYLENLRDELDRYNIQVGYLAGPKGPYFDSRIPLKIKQNEFNLISRPPFIFAKSVWRSGMLVPEKFGLTVIKGNVHNSFSGTRYDLPASEVMGKSGSQ